MPRRSKRGGQESVPAVAAVAAAAVAPASDGEEEEVIDPQVQGNNVAAHVRERQRAVAEREAARLARPEQRRKTKLAHADRKKSAVTSTPFGIFHKNTRDVVPEEEEEWCGPFSVARQMIAKREEAKRKREEELDEDLQNQYHHPLDDIMKQFDQEKERLNHPSMQWKSNLQIAANSGASLYAKRRKRMELTRAVGSHIPTLFQLCVNFVVDHFEYVESLGDVDNDVRLAITQELVSRNQLNSKTFDTLMDPTTMETLEIIDCSGISQDSMSHALESIKGLRYLLLTHAGRCFGPKAIRTLLEKNVTAKMCCLSIHGAYLLQDEDAAKLIVGYATTLRSIAFKTCPLIGEKLFKAIETQMSQGTLLELSLEDMTFSADILNKLSTSKDALKGIRSLTLKSVNGLTDDILSKFLETIGLSLDSLNVSYNYELTDTTLSLIRQYNPRLKTLILNGIKELTSPGLETLFTYPLEGLPPPPKLKVLKLSSVDHQAVTDEVLRLVTASASMQDNESTDHTETIHNYRYSNIGGGLVQLDIQGSTLVTDTMLEQLVETSSNTLEELNVSYCPLISDNGLGYLVSKVGKQLKKISVWGCAQLTDDFFDGHDRVRDQTLHIEGAWMKKSGTRSLR